MHLGVDQQLSPSDQQLGELIAHGESASVEFKESLGGSARERIEEAVCAFANDLPGTGQPGFVIVGLADDGSPVGGRITDRVLTVLSGLRTDGNIVPPPTTRVQKRSYRNREVALLMVEPSDSPPVRYKGVIHVRVGPRRGTATAQDERILNERRRHGNRPFDLQPIPCTTLSDLNLNQFEHDYLKKAVSPEVLEANERSLRQQLAALKMIISTDEPVSTVFGILTIGNNPRDYLPGAYVQFLKFDGTSPADNILDSEEIDGNFVDILRRLDEKFRAHIMTSVDIVSEDIERRNSTYPLPALQQIARNAIMHRTYEGTNAPIRIYWYADRIEMISPGGPFGQVSVENFGMSGLTDYRNPNLSEAMKVLGYIQKYGVGFVIARRNLQESGHPDLRFRVDQNHVMVSILAANR